MRRYSLFAAKKRPLLTNMVLNLLLIVPLAHAGLAPASSISALINAGLRLQVCIVLRCIISLPADIWLADPASQRGYAGSAGWVE